VSKYAAILDAATRTTKQHITFAK